MILGRDEFTIDKYLDKLCGLWDAILLDQLGDDCIEFIEIWGWLLQKTLHYLKIIYLKREIIVWCVGLPICRLRFYLTSVRSHCGSTFQVSAVSTWARWVVSSCQAMLASVTYQAQHMVWASAWAWVLTCWTTLFCLESYSGAYQLKVWVDSKLVVSSISRYFSVGFSVLFLWQPVAFILLVATGQTLYLGRGPMIAS